MSFSARAERALSPADEVKLRQVGDDYEALMLTRLYQQMQSSNGGIDDDPSNPFRPSGAEKIYRAMLDDEVMKRLATTRPLGFGNLVTKQLRGTGGVPEYALVNSKKKAAQKPTSSDE